MHMALALLDRSGSSLAAARLRHAIDTVEDGDLDASSGTDGTHKFAGSLTPAHAGPDALPERQPTWLGRAANTA